MRMSALQTADKAAQTMENCSSWPSYGLVAVTLRNDKHAEGCAKHTHALTCLSSAALP